MSLFLASAFAASLVTAPSCSWNRPGADPFMGNVVEAVDDYRDIPAAIRARLKQRVAARQYDDLATISRDTIVGKRSHLPEVRDMHFGQGRICTTVTRSRWASGTQERGLVYCEAEHCVIVPTVCRNVSRVTRLPAAPAAPTAALGADGLRTHREPAGAVGLEPATVPAEGLASAGAAPLSSGTTAQRPGTAFAQLADPGGTTVWPAAPATPVQPAPGMTPDTPMPGLDDFAPASGGSPPAPPPGPAPLAPSGGGPVPQPISPWLGATGGGGMFLPGGNVTPPIPEPGRAWTLLAGGAALAWMLGRRRARIEGALSAWRA